MENKGGRVGTKESSEGGEVRETNEQLQEPKQFVFLWHWHWHLDYTRSHHTTNGHLPSCSD